MCVSWDKKLKGKNLDELLFKDQNGKYLNHSRSAVWTQSQQNVLIRVKSKQYNFEHFETILTGESFPKKKLLFFFVFSWFFWCLYWWHLLFATPVLNFCCLKRRNFVLLGKSEKQKFSKKSLPYLLSKRRMNFCCIILLSFELQSSPNQQ